MVIDEIPKDKPINSNSEITRDATGLSFSGNPGFVLARPMDRLAAFIIDTFIVFGSVFWLVIAPWRKSLKWSMITDNPGAMVQALLSILSLYILSMMIYRTATTIWLKGQTVGQKCLKLRIVDCWSHGTPTPRNLSIRSFIWIMESIFLGIPFIAIVIDSRHRSLHDKISDTMVIHYGDKKYSQPSSRMVALGQMFYGTILMLPLMVILMGAPRWINSLSQPYSESIDFTGTMGLGCESVSDVFENVRANNIEAVARSVLAFDLFLSGAIGSTCLEEETYTSLQGDKDREWVFLAKAYVHQEKEKRRNSYLDLVCLDWSASVACEIAKVLKKSWKPKKDLLPDYVALGTKSHTSAKLWSVIQLSKSGNYQTAKKYLNEIEQEDWLSQYLISMQAKLEYFLNRKSEARAMAKIIYLAYPQDISVASWMCDEELSAGCSARDSESCQRLQEESWALGEPLKNPNNALAFIRTKECDNTERFDSYLELSKDVAFIEVKLLLRALALEASGRISDSHRVLRRIIGTKKYFPRVRHEALLRLIPMLDEKEALLDVGKIWWDDTDLSEWKKTGKALLTQMNKLGYYDLVLSTGKLWLKNVPMNEFVLKQMLRAHYRMGKDAEGYKLYQTYDKLITKKLARVPASQDEMELIIKKLKGAKK